MKIAIISDIHSNGYALDAVIKDIDSLRIQKILFLGDAVGYYYDSKKVLDILFDRDVEMILGNHDEMLIHSYRKPEDTRSASEVKLKYGSGLKLALEELPSEMIEKISLLPNFRELNIENSKIFMCHGSPFNKDIYIYPTSDISILEECNKESFDLVCMGHTHYPFVWKGKYSLVVNVGSIGQSRVMGGFANWGIWDTSNKVFIPKCTKFDVSHLQKQVIENDPDKPYNYNILSRL